MSPYIRRKGLYTFL